MCFGIRFVLALVAISSVLNCVQAQTLAPTLSQELLQETPETLVLEACESGNIVRGAILFHQGNINCAKCHQNAAGKDRLAPDLSRLATDVTETSLVESILDPSKAISKGFETVNVLMVDGRVVSGLVVDQDNDRVILRDIQDIDKRHEIPRAKIEQLVPANVSQMPNGLADQLENRQQFRDLLRYVIDVKERGPNKTKPTGQAVPAREMSPDLNGVVLIRERNCTACHESSLINSLPAAHQGPNLKWSALRLNPQHLAQFIADPHQTKPGTNMPALMGHLSQSEKRAAAKAIVHFLVSIGGNEFQQSSSRAEDDAVMRGRNVFHSVGCVACHSPRNRDASEQTLPDSVAMGSLANKYDSQSLIEFLEDPHVARPGGRMPDMQLTHRETQDLADYLLQPNNETDDNSTADLATSWKVDNTQVDRGKRLFEELNCAKCHSDVTERRDAPPSFTSLDDLNTEKGCLSSNGGELPNFALTKKETADIKAALGSKLNQLDSQQTIDYTLTSFRCFACHSRDNLGGVSQHRRVHFQTTNLNLGEQGRIPPTLTGVGAKLNPMWTRDVLVNGRSIRPYMKTRMPQYGEKHVGHLVDLFESTDKLSGVKVVTAEHRAAENRAAEKRTVEVQKEIRKVGLNLVGNQGLNCAACHTYQYKLSDTMPAVDLTEMAQRLKKDWFYQYMLAPQKFSPNTVMPSYWPGGKALRHDIAGTPDEQIDAIWQYLLDGRQARAPAGVIKEPLEIVVTDEARMLRRKYSDIGKRGIGVGYPGGVNLAYDAQQMRLAAIWKGKFVDPAAAWYGQGSGDVRPMGPAIRFVEGPDLFDANNPKQMEYNRSLGHQFKGYFLDKERRPTMRYEFGSNDVEDYFREYKDDATGLIQLRRRIKVSSTDKRAQLRFRLASSDKIEVESDTSYRIGDGLVIKVVSGQKAKVANGDLLYLPLEFAPQQTQEIVLDYRWE